jgi:hypothetical protein
VSPQGARRGDEKPGRGLIRRWARDHWPILILGGLLTLVPVPLGLVLLRTSTPEREEPTAVGFVPPVPAAAHQGFSLGMDVSVESCGKPVSVVVVAEATVGYWRDRAKRFPKVGRFRLALPDVVRGDVAVAPGSSASDLVSPYTARDASLTSSAVLGSEFHVATPKTDRGTTVVSGRIRNWSSSLAPIVARFRANWLERSGLRLCQLRLPALVKDYSVFAAQLARGNVVRPDRFEGKPGEIAVSSERLNRAAPYDPGVETTGGITTVRFDEGEVRSSDSLPVADRSIDGNPTWTCDGGKPRETGGLRARRAPDILIGRYGVPESFSRDAVDREAASDCSALVSVAESDADRWRDVILLLIGALVSLGAALLVELGLDLHRRRGRLA